MGFLSAEWTGGFPESWGAIIVPAEHNNPEEELRKAPYFDFIFVSSAGIRHERHERHETGKYINSAQASDSSNPSIVLKRVEEILIKKILNGHGQYFESLKDFYYAFEEDPGEDPTLTAYELMKSMAILNVIPVSSIEEV